MAKHSSPHFVESESGTRLDAALHSIKELESKKHCLKLNSAVPPRWGILENAETRIGILFMFCYQHIYFEDLSGENDYVIGTFGPNSSFK